MPFKMTGKSPLTKALVGKQGKLPENLKAAIKAAPGPSPATMVSPLKETEYAKTLKAARAAGMSQFDYNKKMKADKAASNQGRTEGSGAATANQNAGQTFQDLQKKVAGMSQAQKDKIKKNQNQMSGKKVAKKKPTVNVPERKGVKVNKKAAELNKIRSEAETAEAAYKASQPKGPKVPKTIKKVDTSPKKSEFGKKAINRSGSFTDEYGNTYDRNVKGRKKADGSVSKTISNKTNDVTTREKDVTKGPKVKGKRKAKTVTKTKFDREGKVKKVVTKTRGKKREVSSDSDAKKKREKILADRKRREASPTKMAKSPAKNYKKGY
tara:strand:- start:41 stop:1012 length:972 start_codon:yes stop_codon:yes gene_type:complete